MSKKPRNLPSTTRGSVKHLSEAQQGPEPPTSAAFTSSTSSTDSASSAASPARPRESLFQDLKKKLEGVSLSPDGPPRFPGRNDFPGLSIKILKRVIDVDVRNCVIILHEHSKADPSLHSLALRLQKELPESVFLLLRAFQPSSSGKNGQNHTYKAEAGQSEAETESLKESDTILVDAVKNGLIAKCHFPPRNIVILGHCHGGTAALAAAASWDEVELGGVISVGGVMPAFKTSAIKAKTPALILSGALGNINDAALRRIKEYFTYVESDIRRPSNDDIPKAENFGILLDFFAHRLRGEEWMKQAVMSFGRRLR